MSLKDEVKKKSMEMMSDPRVLKLMQNPQFMKAAMALMQVPGKVNAFTAEQSERFAESLRLATQQDVQELTRVVRKLEREVEQLKQRVAELSRT